MNFPEQPSEENSQEPDEAIVDVSSAEMLDSLSGDEAVAAQKHKTLFRKLGSRPQSKWGYIINKYLKDNPSAKYEDTQKIKKAVKDLREQYS